MKGKKISVALAALLAALPLAGCGGGGGGSSASADPTATTIINLLNYDCGYGRTYIEEAKKSFEEKVKNVSYEPNKKGVFINIESFATGTTGQDVLNSLPTSNYDIFFSNGHTAEAMKLSQHAMELTPFIKAKSSDETKLSDFTEATSIYDRMYSDYREYATASDDKMYNLPLFIGTYNFTYDVDLVVEKGLYIRSDSTDTELQFTNDKTKGCLGVDGEKGTADDGLPETYAQFYLWLDAIYDAGCIPLHFQGGMLKSTFVNWWADFEGVDNVKACWSFDGTVMDDLVESVNDDGSLNYHEPTEITFENGPMVQKQEGRYRALEVMHYLANSMHGSKKLIHSKCFTENHREAQGTYIMSKFDKQPIMLFAEGGYWEAEANAVFNGLENKNSGKMDRNFAILPVPRYSREDVGGADFRRTIPVLANSGDVFIRKEVASQANYQAVVDFFMHFFSEGQMAVTNREASQPLPYNYSTSNVQLSNYQKSLYDLTHDAKTDLVFTSAKNDLAVAYPEQLSTSYYWGFYSRYNPGKTDESYLATKIFYDYKVSVKDYFYGMYNAYTEKPNANAKSKWEQMLETVGL